MFLYKSSKFKASFLLLILQGLFQKKKDHPSFSFICSDLSLMFASASQELFLYFPFWIQLQLSFFTDFSKFQVFWFCSFL